MCALNLNRTLQIECSKVFIENSSCVAASHIMVQHFQVSKAYSPTEMRCKKETTIRQYIETTIAGEYRNNRKTLNKIISYEII